MNSTMTTNRFNQGYCPEIPDRYILSHLTPDSKHLDESFRVCAEAFVDEPGSTHLEVDKSKRLLAWEQFVGHFVDECSSNGMSVMCIDQEKDEVAAVILLRDFASDLPPLLVDCFGQWKDPNFSKQCHYAMLGPLLEVLVNVDEKYVAKSHAEGMEPGTVVDIWMAGTNDSHRGQGLMAACTHKALGLARAKGFKEAMAECTGHYSGRALCKLGAKPIVHTTYADFEVSNGTVGWEVDPPHTKLEIVSFEL